MAELSFEQEVRHTVYRLLLATGRIPSIDDIAAEREVSRNQIEHALETLYKSKALALMPESREILMASPWSAVPTAYVVQAGKKSWWANCAWDALAIPAAMGVEGEIESSCACCGEAMSARVADRRLVEGEGVVHISRPARTWWEDIHFT